MNVNLRECFVASNPFPAERFGEVPYVITRRGVLPVTVRHRARRAVIARRARRARRAAAVAQKRCRRGGGRDRGRRRGRVPLKLGAKCRRKGLRRGSWRNARVEVALRRRRGVRGSVHFPRFANPEALDVFGEVVPAPRRGGDRGGELEDPRAVDLRLGELRPVPALLPPVHRGADLPQRRGEIDITHAATDLDAKVLVQTRGFARHPHRPRGKRGRVPGEERVGDVRAGKWKW